MEIDDERSAAAAEDGKKALEAVEEVRKTAKRAKKSAEDSSKGVQALEKALEEMKGEVKGGLSGETKEKVRFACFLSSSTSLTPSDSSTP